MVARELRDQNAIIEDPEVNEYLQTHRPAPRRAERRRRARTSSSSSSRTPRSTPSPCPAASSSCNEGLVLATTTESELAERHGARNRARHAAPHRAPDPRPEPAEHGLRRGHPRGHPARRHRRRPGAWRAASPPRQGLAVQQQINFTRDNEMEADRVGIGYLAGAGFDPNAMGGFFETMSRHEGLAATYIPAMLIDHPVTTDRIAEARARAAQFPPRTEHDSQSYELIRERVRVLTTSADIDLADHYERKIARGDARSCRPLRLCADSPAEQPRRRGRQGADAAGAAARDPDTAARGARRRRRPRPGTPRRRWRPSRAPRSCSRATCR